MIKFAHQNPLPSFGPRCTFAISIPKKETLLQMLTNGIGMLEHSIGVAKVHPKDQLNKKTGRELALKRHNVTTSCLINVHIRDNNRVVYVFTNYSDTEGPNALGRIEFAISYIPESDHTRLEYIFAE